MAMALGRSRTAQHSDTNMTPMIDVLLVLLIIFMVVQQGLRSGVSVQAPPIEPSGPAAPEQMVLSIEPGPRYALNSQAIPAARLTAELRSVFAERPRKVLLVDGAEEVAYGEVIHAIDASRAAGVELVGVIPRKP